MLLVTGDESQHMLSALEQTLSQKNAANFRKMHLLRKNFTERKINWNIIGPVLTKTKTICYSEIFSLPLVFLTVPRKEKGRYDRFSCVQVFREVLPMSLLYSILAISINIIVTGLILYVCCILHRSSRFYLS